MRKSVVIAVVAVSVGACSDPFAGIDRVSDDPSVLPPDAQTMVAQETDVPENPRILSTLFGIGVPAPVAETTAADPTLPVAKSEPEQPASRTGLKGLFGALTRQSAPEAVTASLSNPSGVPAPEAQSVVPAFGNVASACGMARDTLGTKIEETAGYQLYDTEPDSTAQRTFYVTGFDDKCPRQFRAAVALFGAPSMHETLRYGRPSDAYPYSDTDEAYERIKRAVCGVGKTKPCGKKIDRLERATVFISTYEQFADNGRWSDILLHDGEVVATAFKQP